MKLKYSDTERRVYLTMTEQVGKGWVDVFQGNTDFYQASYWDLFTQMWKVSHPVRKTDALKFMVGIKSAQTASKYVETAIAEGYILEKENPKDARSRLLELSPEMRQRLDGFFDHATDEMVRAASQVQTPTPSNA